jgi:hypothetical protein
MVHAENFLVTLLAMFLKAMQGIKLFVFDILRIEINLVLP